MKKMTFALVVLFISLTALSLFTGCKKQIEEEKDIYADLNPEEVFNDNKIFVKIKRDFEVDSLQTAVAAFNTLLYFKDIKTFYKSETEDTFKLIIAFPDTLQAAVEFASRKIDKLVDQHMYMKREKFDQEKIDRTSELQKMLKSEIVSSEPDSMKVDSLKAEIGAIMKERLIWLFNDSYTLAYFTIYRKTN